MVTVVLYAQPSRDEEDDLRPENTVIESLEGFDSFQIMGKKLSMFQIIGVVFGVTLLVLLIWSAYRKRETQRRIKKASEGAIETGKKELKTQADSLFQIDPSKASRSRKNSLEIAYNNVESTLNSIYNTMKDSIGLRGAEKAAALKSLNDFWNKNKDEFKDTLETAVITNYGKDQTQSIIPRIQADIQEVTKSENRAAEAVSAATASFVEVYGPKQPAPKPGFFSRLWGRGRQ
jgi:hypothetical protein